MKKLERNLKRDMFIISALEVIAVVFALFIGAIFLSSCGGQRTPIKKCVGVITKELEPDTIYGRRDTLVTYNYVVKEEGNPELQLIKRYNKDIHDVGDTLCYTRQMVPAN